MPRAAKTKPPQRANNKWASLEAFFALCQADVVSLGMRHDLDVARRAYPNLVFQGNVDESILKAGTRDQVKEATRQCLHAGGGRRHILNLNHGVDKATPVENFEAYVEEAKRS